MRHESATRAESLCSPPSSGNPLGRRYAGAAVPIRSGRPGRSGRARGLLTAYAARIAAVSSSGWLSATRCPPGTITGSTPSRSRASCCWNSTGKKRSSRPAMTVTAAGQEEKVQGSRNGRCDCSPFGWRWREPPAARRETCSCAGRTRPDTRAATRERCAPRQRRYCPTRRLASRPVAGSWG